jgi:hypothetical protein
VLTAEKLDIGASLEHTPYKHFRRFAQELETLEREHMDHKITETTVLKI